MGFIEDIAPIVQKYAPQYGIKVCSPIIAQAVLESAAGTSYKATYGHNYFGLKYRENRCPIACGKFLDRSAEQNANGTYTNITDYWFKFRSMEEGVIGYLQFINTSAYAGLKGLADPRQYLETIKAAKYATSLKYVDNVMAVIKKYDLERYDNCKEEEEKKGMKIILTVGHSILKTGSCTSADGRPFGGVLEYAYNKNIVNQVAEYLRSVGHVVDVLICPELQFSKSADEKAYKLNRVNSGGYDLVCELHLNASVLHNAQGCEVLYISENGKTYAQQVLARLATIFKSRGIQKRDGLYMLNSTEPTAIMLETFFCDSSTDCALAEKNNVALRIAEGIHGGDIVSKQDSPAETVSGMMYRVQTGAFSVWKNAEKLKAELQKKEFDAFITTVDLGQLFYRVQVGAFSVKSNAEAMKKKLQVAGFDALIVQV